MLNINGTNLLYTKYVLIGGVSAEIVRAQSTDTNVVVIVPYTVIPGSNIAVVLITETGTCASMGLTVTAPMPRLAEPMLNQPTNITSDGFTVSWAAVAGADGYQARLNGGAPIATGPGLSFRLSGLPANTFVAVDVQALDSTGAKQASIYSKVVSATTTADQGTNNYVQTGYVQTGYVS